MSGLTSFEEVVRIDHLATAFNAKKMLREGKRILLLACGHAIYSRAFLKARCPRCAEMMRRSLLGEADWLAYREGDGRDTMIWREDPCRMFNEPTDLAGNFIND